LFQIASKFLNDPGSPRAQGRGKLLSEESEKLFVTAVVMVPILLGLERTPPSWRLHRSGQERAIRSALGIEAI